MESRLVPLSGEPKIVIHEEVNPENQKFVLTKEYYNKEDKLLWGANYIPVGKPRQELFDRVNEQLDQLKTEDESHMVVIVTCTSHYKSHTDL